MKTCVCILTALLIIPCVHALYYDIAPADGYSEPLSSGDVIGISQTTQPSPGTSYAYSEFWLYYNFVFLGAVSIPEWPFDIDDLGFVTGSAPLDVDTYVAANNVNLHIVTIPGLQKWNSNNNLQVQPTGPMVPTTGIWGLALLLLGIPAVILWRK